MVVESSRKVGRVRHGRQRITEDPVDANGDQPLHANGIGVPLSREQDESGRRVGGSDDRPVGWPHPQVCD